MAPSERAVFLKAQLMWPRSVFTLQQRFIHKLLALDLRSAQ